ARARQDLFPDRKQIAWLLSFVERKRHHFPVSMADEFGYCGEWEPKVRDMPFLCGAGRMQCVVLTDGEVVPCTTMDRSTSSGNLADHSLAEIWQMGFAELRKWTPEGKCQHCDYAVACQGGCWLQQRRGTQCYRDVWHIPGAFENAAAAAICLGALATFGATPALAQETPAKVAPAIEKTDLECSGAIEEHITRWYGSQMPEQSSGRTVEIPTIGEMSTDDPGGAFVKKYISGQISANITVRCEAVDAALETQEPSMALAALMWRSLAEISFDKAGTSGRTPAESESLSKVMARLELKVHEWRSQIIEAKLDPYLARGRDHRIYRFEQSKAYIPAPNWLKLSRNTQVERWGPIDPAEPESLDRWLARHIYAQTLRLKVDIDQAVSVHSPQGATEFKSTELAHFWMLEVRAATGP
ncbi:MAG: SPASM domain-containing protein, partial [Proteobacteria bacterium]|nr:SPASM domain-containing protein [Pseudomonadota bacterium]